MNEKTKTLPERRFRDIQVQLSRIVGNGPIGYWIFSVEATENLHNSPLANPCTGLATAMFTVKFYPAQSRHSRIVLVEGVEVGEVARQWFEQLVAEKISNRKGRKLRRGNVGDLLEKLLGIIAGEATEAPPELVAEIAAEIRRVFMQTHIIRPAANAGWHFGDDILGRFFVTDMGHKMPV